MRCRRLRAPAPYSVNRRHKRVHTLSATPRSARHYYSTTFGNALLKDNNGSNYTRRERPSSLSSTKSSTTPTPHSRSSQTSTTHARSCHSPQDSPNSSTRPEETPKLWSSRKTSENRLSSKPCTRTSRNTYRLTNPCCENNVSGNSTPSKTPRSKNVAHTKRAGHATSSRNLFSVFPLPAMLTDQQQHQKKLTKPTYSIHTHLS